jgi:hypothetical protein
VKEKFFLRGKASYKVKSSDWRCTRAAKAVLGKYRPGTTQEEQYEGMSVVRGDLLLDLI